MKSRRAWFQGHRNGRADVRVLTTGAVAADHTPDNNTSFTQDEGVDGSLRPENAMKEGDHAADHRDG